MTLPYNGGNFSMPLFSASNVMSEKLKRVNGLDSAKAYPMAPNSEVALFEENDDVMYIKMTDSNNFPSLRKFRFVEEPLEVPNKEQYVTLDEFKKFKEELLNAQQSIWEQRTPNSANNYSSAEPKRNSFDEQHSANKKFDVNGKK